MLPYVSMPVGLNTLHTVVGNQTGRRLDPYPSHNFMVEVTGLLVGGFSKVSGLESSLEIKQYAEGGVNGYLHQIPGETRYPNLVLTQGYLGLDLLYTWYTAVAAGIIKRRNITVMLLGPQRAPVTWWTVLDAIPVKWTGPSFDASRDAEVAIESVELCHRGIQKPIVARAMEIDRAVIGYYGT